MVNSKELDAMGLLRATKVPHELDWLTDDEKVILLRLLFCGEEGMHIREVSKIQKTQSGSDAILRIEAFGLAGWERDQLGKQTFLCLTWKGTEAAELVRKVARHENKKAVNAERGNA